MSNYYLPLSNQPTNQTTKALSGEVAIIDLADCTQLHTQRVHRGAVSALAFSAQNNIADEKIIESERFLFLPSFALSFSFLSVFVRLNFYDF